MTSVCDRSEVADSVTHWLNTHIYMVPGISTRSGDVTINNDRQTEFSALLKLLELNLTKKELTKLSLFYILSCLKAR